MFYNTGIATYIWVLTNRKPEHRKGKVQLIDATQWFKPLRKNLGKKNCELSDEDIAAHLRHLPRLRGDRAVEDLPQRRLRLLEGDGRAAAAPQGHRPGARLHAEGDQGAQGDAPSATDDAPPVIRKIHKKGDERRSAARPVRGDHRRQACRRRVRARPRPARHRAGAAARRGRHRGVPAPRGAAARAGRLVRRRTASRSATRSASRATSTSRSRCARWRRSAPTSWRWSGRPRGCWARSWGASGRWPMKSLEHR